jgi:hypothetical protein
LSYIQNKAKNFLVFVEDCLFDSACGAVETEKSNLRNARIQDWVSAQVAPQDSVERSGVRRTGRKILGRTGELVACATHSTVNCGATRWQRQNAQIS